MDFGLAFSFPFKDQQWFKKLVVPGLVSLIPIIGQFFMVGFGLNVAKRVIEKDPESLPNLDFGGDLKRGFMSFVIGLGYSLPLIVLALIFGIIMVAIGGLAGDNNSEVAGILSVVSAAGFGIISIIYGIVLAFFTSAALGNYLAKGEELGAAFRFREIWELLRRAIVPYLFVILGGFLANLVGSLGSIICAVGLLLTMPYAMAVYGHFIGQAYSQAITTRED
jgi:ABC-type multidrug transport system permease subunit